MSEFAHDAVAIRGDDLDQQAHAARAVPLEHSFFILFALELAGSAEDGTLDVFVRHVFVLARQNSRSQAGIGVRIASADAGGDADFTNNSSENAAALCVSGRFLVLDCC